MDSAYMGKRIQYSNRWLGEDSLRPFSLSGDLNINLSLVYVWRKRRQEHTTQEKRELGVLETGTCAQERQGGWSRVIRVVGRERSEATRSRGNCVRPCKYSD